MKKRKRLNRQNSGISMISLVVTSIALLVLASVTITSLTGDSSVTQKAENAINQTITGGNLENDTLTRFC